MVDRSHPLPVVRQCQLLELPRSTYYYRKRPVITVFTGARG